VGCKTQLPIDSLGTADVETAKYLSDTLGQRTIEFTTTNKGRQLAPLCAAC
jgi:hypothetical protein